MAYREGFGGHQVITEKGLERHLQEKEVLVKILNRSRGVMNLPSNKGRLVKFPAEKSIYFFPEIRRSVIPSFEMVRGRVSIGFLTKYPSTCKQPKGAVFYRMYDYS